MTTKKEYRNALLKDLGEARGAHKRARGKNRLALQGKMDALVKALEANRPLCANDGEPVVVLVWADIYGLTRQEQVMHSEYERPPYRADSNKACKAPVELQEEAVMAEVAA